MFYAKLEDGAVTEWPIYSDNLRARFPHISFPAGPFDPPEGYVAVTPSATPETDHTKNVTEIAPVLNEGVWTQTFKVSDASVEEISERVAAAWVGIRQQRSLLLNTSDWTQLPDAPVEAAVWAEYRQALRDITKQGDPFNIVWPEPPQ